MAAARSSSRSRTIARDPPSSGDLERDALNASDEATMDAFFASASPSVPVGTPNERPPTDVYRSAEHNPEVLPSAIYTRSRSISPRKARSQMAPPTATSSTTAHYIASSRRSHSQGRSSNGTNTSVSSSIDARSRASSRSRSSRRSQRHMSKSRNSSNATAASVASALTAAEGESQFLDSLANQLSSNAAARTREYAPSIKSLENSRIIRGVNDIANARIMIDRQVQKIRERGASSTNDAVPMHPQPTPPVTDLPSRPTSGNWLPAKSDGSYGTSLEAASSVLSEGARPPYGANMSPLRTLSASEQAYTHGLGRDRPMNPFEDEDDDFSAFGAIMSSDGSLPPRRRKGKTPRKLQNGNDLCVKGSPDAVSDFQEF